MKARFFFIPIAIALLSACSGYLPEEPRLAICSVEMKYSVETLADGNRNPAFYEVTFDSGKAGDL